MLSKTLISLMLLFIVCQGQDLSGKTLKVGTFPGSEPNEFLQNGTVVGFDIDLFQAVSQVAGFQYNISQLGFVDIFGALSNSTIDVGLSGITITAVRNQTYDFSVPYFSATFGILTKNTTSITGGQDLINYKVAVWNGTTGVDAVVYLFGGDSSNPNIIRCADVEEGFKTVANGTADAFVTDSPLVIYYANNNPGYVVIEDTNSFYQQFYGIMFQKGSDLVDPINSALTQVIQDGTYDTIYQKWFGASADTDLLLQAGQNSNPYAIFVKIVGGDAGNSSNASS